MWEGSFECDFFYVVHCVLRDWVLGGGGFNGYFREQELPVSVQECLEWFHRGIVDYPAVCFKMGQPEWWRRIGDGGYNISVGGTYRRGRVSLCVLKVWRWTPRGIPEDYEWSWTWILLLESCFIREIPKTIHKLKSELLCLFQCLCVAKWGGMGGLNNIFKMWPDKHFVQGEKKYWS